MNNLYYSSPLALFALLAPPALDPAFALQLSAFRLIMRVHALVSDRNKLKLALESLTSAEDEPSTRAKQLSEHPVFSQVFQDFLNNSLPPTWEHDLRETFRLQNWCSL